MIFLISFFLGAILRQTFKILFIKFPQFFSWTYMIKIGRSSSETPTNYCVFVLRFSVSEHGMPCALERNRNGGCK